MKQRKVAGIEDHYMIKEPIPTVYAPNGRAEKFVKQKKNRTERQK